MTRAQTALIDELRQSGQITKDADQKAFERHLKCKKSQQLAGQLTKALEQSTGWRVRSDERLPAPSGLLPPMF